MSWAELAQPTTCDTPNDLADWRLLGRLATCSLSDGGAAIAGAFGRAHALFQGMTRRRRWTASAGAGGGIAVGFEWATTLRGSLHQRQPNSLPVLTIPGPERGAWQRTRGRWRPCRRYWPGCRKGMRGAAIVRQLARRAAAGAVTARR
ncbi:hypothetical protein MJ585_16225 [Klebsiella pneumoniae]|nr:hypothetical protein MJ585_16225 [Klebsiella pneumoniae]